MTAARFAYVQDGLQLTVTGHATGYPEVCAAISAITSALAGWLKHNRTDAAIQLSRGAAWLQCGRSAGAEIAFDVARVGMLNLAKTYPDAVQVEEVGA